MIAKFVFSAILFSAFVYAWVAHRQARGVGAMVALIASAGLYFVWLPNHSMIVAEWMGIGRGLDLIFGIWVVFSLLVFFNLHLKLKAQTQLVTRLTRAIALADYRQKSQAPDHRLMSCAVISRYLLSERMNARLLERQRSKAKQS